MLSRLTPRWSGRVKDKVPSSTVRSCALSGLSFRLVSRRFGLPCFSLRVASVGFLPSGLFFPALAVLPFSRRCAKLLVIPIFRRF